MNSSFSLFYKLSCRLVERSIKGKKSTGFKWLTARPLAFVCITILRGKGYSKFFMA